MFRAGYIELTKVTAQQQKQKQGAAATGGLSATDGGEIENVERALRRSYTTEMTFIESLIPFLATTGSAAPLVGLFGTVWGIMNAFAAIANRHQGLREPRHRSTRHVQALITTAIGLVAAIPAVMACNDYPRKIKVLSVEMESFSNDFLHIVKRHFLR